MRHTCANILILDEAREKVLLARRAAHLLEGGKWCVPGGYMELGQRARESAVREAKEETGYDVELLGLIGIIDNPERGDNGRENIVLVFAGIALGEQGVPDNESSEVAWFPLSSPPAPGEWAFDHRQILETYRARGVLPGPLESLFLGGRA